MAYVQYVSDSPFPFPDLARLGYSILPSFIYLAGAQNTQLRSFLNEPQVVERLDLATAVLTQPV